MEFSTQKRQYKLMTGTAMVAGAAAASPRFGGRGDKLGTALEAES